MVQEQLERREFIRFIQARTPVAQQAILECTGFGQAAEAVREYPAVSRSVRRFSNGCSNQTGCPVAVDYVEFGGTQRPSSLLTVTGQCLKTPK